MSNLPITTINPIPPSKITLPKAIEILKDHTPKSLPYFDPPFVYSLLLGTEALKREQHRRKYDIHLPVELLPGESDGP